MATASSPRAASHHQRLAARPLTLVIQVAAFVALFACRPALAASDAVEAELAKALGARGWVELPAPIKDVRNSGPTAAAAGGRPGPSWFVTTDIDDNNRPFVSKENEEAFVRSVEAAHAGRTRVIEGGLLLLVDPAGRYWSVAAHMPHLL